MTLQWDNTAMCFELDFRSKDEGGLLHLSWSTDLHLDAADKAHFRMFYEQLVEHEPDFVLIGGDISNGIGSLKQLSLLQDLVKKPFYFVLGNHDYYHGSIANIRKQAKKLSADHPHITYLTASGVIPLSEKTALIGHDGWADGRAGDFLNSDILLNDYFLIDELKHLNPHKRLSTLNILGDEAADSIQKLLKEAFSKKFERVILLTHVPPFAAASTYEGVPSKPNWSPHFVCQAVGDVLKEFMERYPTKELLVLCGHSHSGNDIQILPNLRVVTGESELGLPNVQGLIFVN